MTPQSVPGVRSSDELRGNRELWSLVNEQFTGTDAASKWGEPGISWGLFAVPDEHGSGCSRGAAARIVVGTRIGPGRCPWMERSR